MSCAAPDFLAVARGEIDAGLFHAGLRFRAGDDRLKDSRPLPGRKNKDVCVQIVSGHGEHFSGFAVAQACRTLQGRIPGLSSDAIGDD